MIYLDNASTTRPQFFVEKYDNSWMNHNARYAYELQHVITDCRDKIKQCIGANGGKIIFCRCATEAIEVIGRKFCALACSPKEHDCVWNNCNIHQHGWQYNSDAQGYVCQLVNQLTGEYDFEIDKKGISVHVTNQYLICDATAAIGKVEIPKNLDNWCDALFFSCHKIHGPHIGVLWIGDRLCEAWGLSDDERNNYDFLHGTLDSGAVIAATDAIFEATSYIDRKIDYYDDLLQTLISELIRANIPHDLIGDSYDAADYTSATSAIVLPGVNADALQQWLAGKNCFIGIGASACSQSHDYRVLCDGYNLSKQKAEQTIRISFSMDNDKQDILDFVEYLKEYRNIFCKN
nr:MAG TPA: cysteine sulfinate desulfinase/cysteine desulfurase [Caudoviricetes sp.]